LVVVGSEVPAVTRVDQRGTVVNLRSGEPTLLYFYPKDGTPGCTKEACAIRDAWKQYQLVQLRVIGVSADTDDAHRAFSDEHTLPFSLIADPTHTWSRAMGVSEFNGKDERVSFLIDKNNRIVKTYPNVDPAVHADEVLRDAKALGLTP
jgi:peroxiredoxin Q/BCP